MNNVKILASEITELLEQVELYRDLVKGIDEVLGEGWSLEDIAQMKKSGGGGVNHDTQKVIDLTINAVESQLDDVYCYREEPHLDVNDYENEVSINLYGKDDEFRLDADEVCERVLESLIPKEVEPKEEKESPFSDDDKNSLMDVIAGQDASDDAPKSEEMESSNE